MSEDLVRYAVEATSERLLALTLEDIAICLAWYNGHTGEPAVIEAYRTLPEQVARWSADKVHTRRVTEGARQQPVLRYCLDALQLRGVSGLHRDELDLLFYLHNLIQRAKVRSQFQRPLDHIAPHIEAIGARRETVEAVRGLPNLSRHVIIATEATIRNAGSREISSFGGLRESFRGPVFHAGATLKIVGDVPDGTAVVVENGTCYVSGYVLGRLLVSEHAEVQENIAGLLISQRGNIRARGIINRASVIAKAGRIACGNTEAPGLVYAGTQIRISDTARQGTYFSPRIRVQNEIDGGLWHVTVELAAGAFAHSDPRPLDIVFRTAIGFEDFGEAVPKEAATLLRSATRMQARIDYLRQLRDRQAEEAEHYARTALLYLCGGAGAPDTLNQMDSLKRRRAFLVRVIMGLHLLTRSLSVQSKSVLRGKGGKELDHGTIQRAIARSLSEVTRELSDLKLEGNYPAELDAEWEELMALYASSAAVAAGDGFSRAIARFHESRKAWQEEVMRLEEKIDALSRQFGADDTRRALLERVRDEGTSQTLLLQLARAAMQRGPQDAVRKRLETPFVRRMLVLLKKRNAWVKQYDDEAREKGDELASTHKKLLENYTIEPAAQQASPSAEGRFQEGARLHVEELHSPSAEELNGVVLVTGGPPDRLARYGVADGIITPLPV